MSAKQKKSQHTARERLASISHHFLSDTDDSEVEECDNVYTFALLNTTDEGYELPVFSLSRQLASRGLSSAILDCDAGMNIVSFFPRNVSRSGTVHHDLNRPTPEDINRRLGNKPHDVYFLLVDTPLSSCLLLANRVLLAAPATPEGIQRTYITIKQMLEQHHDIEIGVIITEAAKESTGEYYYNRLSSATRLFLDYKLLNYGYLPISRGIAGQPETDVAETVALTGSGIDTIAKVIYTEIEGWKQNSVRDGTSQSINPASTKVQ